jgi:creatinine amidohydrolase
LEAAVRYVDLTLPEVARVVTEGAVAVIPLGCTEQQGPHLAVGFDSWFADELCVAASQRSHDRFGVISIVVPVLPFGPTPEHRGFGSGFVDLPPRLHDALLEAIVASLVDQGFAKIMVWRGCGGHDLVAAVKRCNRRWAGLARVVLPSHPFDEIWRRVGDADAPGGHADSFATSIALYRHPELVHVDRIPEPSAAPDWSSPHLDFTEYSSSGVIGDARSASGDLGARLWEACVDALAALISATATAPDDVGIERLPTAGPAPGLGGSAGLREPPAPW